MSTAYQGSFSYDKYGIFAPSVAAVEPETRQRRYKLLYQKGKALADSELMQEQEMNDSFLRQLIYSNFRDGSSINDGFKINESTVSKVNNFTVAGGDGTVNGAGLLFVDGYILYLKSNIEFNNQGNTGTLDDDDYTESTTFVYEDDGAGNITAKGGVGTYSTPLVARTDYVFVDLYFAEVSPESGSEYEDTDLVVSGINTTTALRVRQVQDIKVIENATTLPGTAIISGFYHYEVDANGIYHRYVKIAEIARVGGDGDVDQDIITDTRIKVNSLYSYMDGTAENVFIAGPLGVGTDSVSYGDDPSLFVHGGHQYGINSIGISTEVTESIRIIGNASFGSQGSIFFGDSEYVFISEYDDDDLLISSGNGYVIIDANSGVGIGTSQPQTGSQGLQVEGNIFPSADGNSDLGDASHRFANLFMASTIDHDFASTFIIQASDGVIDFAASGTTAGIGTSAFPSTGRFQIFSTASVAFSAASVGISTNVSPIMRLSGSGANQSGGQVIFGDGNYVHLTEYKDDSLLIGATGYVILDAGIGVGIGLSEPTVSGGLDVQGTILSRSSIGIGTTNLTGEFEVWTGSSLPELFVNGTFVGIGTNTNYNDGLINLDFDVYGGGIRSILNGSGDLFRGSNVSSGNDAIIRAYHTLASGAGAGFIADARNDNSADAYFGVRNGAKQYSMGVAGSSDRFLITHDSPGTYLGAGQDIILSYDDSTTPNFIGIGTGSLPSGTGYASIKTSIFGGTVYINPRNAGTALAIQGTSTASIDAKIENNSTTVGARCYIEIENDANGHAYLRIKNANDDFVVGVSSNNAGLCIRNALGNPALTLSQIDPSLFIKGPVGIGTGNVGIGTTMPVSALEVNGAIATVPDSGSAVKWKVVTGTTPGSLSGNGPDLSAYGITGNQVVGLWGVVLVTPATWGGTYWASIDDNDATTNDSGIRVAIEQGSGTQVVFRNIGSDARSVPYRLTIMYTE